MFVYTSSFAPVTLIVVRGTVCLYFLYWIVTFPFSQILAQCLTYDNQQRNTGEFQGLAYTLRVLLASRWRMDYRGQGWRHKTGYKDLWWQIGVIWAKVVAMKRARVVRFKLYVRSRPNNGLMDWRQDVRGKGESRMTPGILVWATRWIVVPLMESSPRWRRLGDSELGKEDEI